MIYTEKTKEIKEKTEKNGGIPWRVSSTMFGHIRHDVMLEPILKFRNDESIKLFPKMTVYE